MGNFWSQLDDESEAAVKQLPPLTDETLAAAEAQFGVKLPRALVDLLRSRNGGYLENRDFKLNGESFSVHEILGITLPQEFSSLGPLLCLDGEEAEEMREQFEQKAGEPAKLIQFAGADCWSYMLDYNRLNAAGEPTIIQVCLDDPEDVGVKRMADSIEEFMQGHYFGDAEPLVRLEEADKYQLVAQGGYEGMHTITGRAIRIAWKICAHRNRLIVFQREEGWKEGETCERSELFKSALCLEFVPLEDYGVELEPELAEMIRPAVEPEILGEFDVPVKPACYQFVLHVQARKDRRISKQTSEAFEGRWKNESFKVLNTAVYSADKAALERTIEAVAQSCSGLRRFLG